MDCTQGILKIGIESQAGIGNLKMFVQECYTRRLNASNITSGVQGYVQNAFAVLQEESEEEDDDVQTVITQMAALQPKVNSRQIRRQKLQHR